MHCTDLKPWVVGVQISISSIHDRKSVQQLSVLVPWGAWSLHYSRRQFERNTTFKL